MTRPESIDKIILAVDPRLHRVRAFKQEGMTQGMFGQPKVPIYVPLEGFRDEHTLEALKHSSYQANFEPRVFSLTETYRNDTKQARLF